MKTNFFELIGTLEFQGAMNLNLLKNAEGLFTISVFIPNATGDSAGNVIPPMILKGNAAELDEGFFGAIAAPVKQTASLFANMDAYQQSLKKATEQSKQELDKKSKDKGKGAIATPETEEEDETDEGENLFSVQENEQKAIAEKKKRYDDAMNQISELNKVCKYDDAIALLPTVEEYPEKADEIKAKAEVLAKRKAQYEQLMQEV